LGVSGSEDKSKISTIYCTASKLQQLKPSM
jgi:hypothetical protein